LEFLLLSGICSLGRCPSAKLQEEIDDKKRNLNGFLFSLIGTVIFDFVAFWGWRLEDFESRVSDQIVEV